MPKTLLRLVALLLVPCLLTDPVSAVAHALESRPVLKNRFSPLSTSHVFGQEALVEYIVHARAAYQAKGMHEEVKIARASRWIEPRRVPALLFAFTLVAAAIAGLFYAPDKLGLFAVPLVAVVVGAGSPRVVDSGRIQWGGRTLEISLDPNDDSEARTYLILLGFSPGRHYFPNAVKFLRKLVVHGALYWFPGVRHRQIEEDLQNRWKTLAAGYWEDTELPLADVASVAQERENILADLRRLPEDVKDKRMADIVSEAALNLGIYLNVYSPSPREWIGVPVEFIMNAPEPLAYNSSRHVLQADLFAYLRSPTPNTREFYAAVFRKMRSDESRPTPPRDVRPAPRTVPAPPVTPFPPSVHTGGTGLEDMGRGWDVRWRTSLVTVLFIALFAGWVFIQYDFQRRWSFFQSSFLSEILKPTPRMTPSKSAESPNIYEPDAPAGPGAQTTYDRIDTVMGPYSPMDAQGMLPRSGSQAGSGGTNRPLQIDTFREVIDLRFSGHASPGLLMMDIANALGEGGRLRKIGVIDFVPSDAVTRETTQAELHIPGLVKGQAMRLPVAIDERVLGVSDPRLAANAQGWVTASQDLPANGVDLTATLVRTSQNGSYQGEQPMTPWMQKERDDMPVYMREELARAQDFSDVDRASVVAGLFRKYYGYRSTARVELHQGTWMALTATYLETHTLFVGDCDVLVANALTLLRAARIPAFVIIGRNNSDGRSLIGRERAHAWLVIRLGGRWLIFDPSSLVTFFPDSAPAPDAGRRASAAPSPAPSRGSGQAGPSVAPAALRPSEFRAQVFVPNTAVYPPPQTRYDIEEKARRLQQRSGQTPSKPAAAAVPVAATASVYRVQPGQSFDEVARIISAARGRESFWYPLAYQLMVDNILSVIDGDVDRLPAGMDLIVRPDGPYYETGADVVWEQTLLEDLRDRSWYERRLEALRQALDREKRGKSSAFTDAVQGELKRRAGSRWFDIEGDIRARDVILQQIARDWGLNFERIDLVAILQETLTISEELLEPPADQSSPGGSPKRTPASVDNYGETGYVFGVATALAAAVDFQLLQGGTLGWLGLAAVSALTLALPFLGWLTSFFISQASRMQTALDRRPSPGPNALLKEWTEEIKVGDQSRSAIIDLEDLLNPEKFPGYKGSRDLRDYRGQVSFVLQDKKLPAELRGRIVADKKALAHLSAERQRTILVEELAHLDLSWKGYKKAVLGFYVRQDEALANRQLRGETRVKAAMAVYALKKALLWILNGILYAVRSPRLHFRVFTLLFPLMLALSSGHAQPVFHVYSDEAMKFYQEWYAKESQRIASEIIGKPWSEMSIQERRQVAFDVPLSFLRQESIEQEHIQMQKKGVFDVEFNGARQVGRDARPLAGDLADQIRSGVEEQSWTRTLSYKEKLFPGASPPVGLTSLGGSVRRINLSKFSIAWNHILIVPQRFRPQFYTLKDAYAALELLWRGSGLNRTAGFNSWGGGGSINYLHLHEFDTFPEDANGPRRGLPIERFRGARQALIGDVEIARESADWPGRALFLSSSNRQQLAVVVSRLADLMQARNIAHNIDSYKEKQSDGSYVYRMIVMPHDLNKETVPNSPFSAFGQLEMAGRFILADEESYHLMNEDMIRTALDFISLPAGATGELLSALQADFQAENSIERVRREQEQAAEMIEDIYETLYPGDSFAEENVLLNPYGRIPKRLIALYRANPDAVRKMFARMKAGQPLSVTNPRTAPGIEWQPNPELVKAVEILERRLDGQAQGPTDSWRKRFADYARRIFRSLWPWGRTSNRVATLSAA